MYKALYRIKMEIRFSLPSEISVLGYHNDEKYSSQKHCEELMWSKFQGFFLHAAYKMKDPQPDIIESLFNVLYVSHKDLI